MTGSAVYRIQFINKLALIDGNDREIRLPTRKALFLLAVLALDGQVRWSRADLASLVWPEGTPEMARASLRTAVRMIRKATVANSISSERDEIWLDRSLFAVDWDGLEEVSRPQDILPGLSHEWVAEQRRMFVLARVTNLIKSAERLLQQGCRESATRDLNEANELDPTDERVIALQSRLHSEMGGPYKTPLLPGRSEHETREESSLVQAVHPLVPAAEFLLAADPEQALEFLASTQEHWKSVQVKLAADLHRRVLRSAKTVGASRRRVEAIAIWFEAVGGFLDPSSEAPRHKLSEAFLEADRANAVLIATAISISAQQRGALKVAHKYAQIVSQILMEGRDPDSRPRALFQLANIERHCGFYDLAKSRNLEAMREYEEIGSGQGVAVAHLTAATDCIWSRDLGRAADHVEFSRQHFHAARNERLKPWITLAEAWLTESSGNPIRARRILVDLRNDDGDRNGRAFQAGVEDHLLLVDTRLGEWDQSAVAWGKGRHIRRISGLAPTAFERDLSRPSKALLKQRMGLEELRKYWADGSVARPTATVPAVPSGPGERRLS